MISWWNMDISKLKMLVKAMISTASKEDAMTILADFFGKEQGKALSVFVNELQSCGVHKVFDGISIEDRRIFIKHLGRAAQMYSYVFQDLLPKYAEKQESITRLLGVGAYQVNESISADEELGMLSNQVDEL